MFSDAKEELQRLEKELLEEEANPADGSVEDDFLKEIMDLLEEEEEPRQFEETVYYGEADPQGNMRNFANGYGEYQDTDDEEEDRQPPKGDGVFNGLAITAMLLTLGILGVLVRWLLLFVEN